MKRFAHGLILATLVATTTAAQHGSEQSPEQRQAKAEKDAAAESGMIAALAPDNCFTSGSGDTYLRVCISENGNISWIESPEGKVHLKTREGYAICSYDGTYRVHGFDVNSAAEGWGASVVSDNKRVITRTSLDGLIQLKQTFTVVPAWRGVDVKMEVKTLSPVQLAKLMIARRFDADIDGQLDNTIFNSSSAIALTRGRMLLLTLVPVINGEFLKFAVPYDEWNPLGSGQQLARGCQSQLWPNGSTGDYVAGLTTSFDNVKPGQTKTVTLGYRRY